MYNNSNEERLETYQIRNFHGNDAKDTAQLIKNSLFETNQEDCLLERIESFAKNFNADKILEINSYSEIYVMCIHKRIVACGIISKQFEEESILLAVFVASHLHGKGISKKMITWLEKEESYLNARRIQIASSIAACKYYKKMESIIKKERHHVSA